MNERKGLAMFSARWRERRRWDRDRHAELCRKDGDGRPNVKHGPGFLYRPRQVLVGTDTPLLPTVVEQLTRRGGVPDNELDRGFATAGLPVRAFLMPAEVDIPALVTRLRRQQPREPIPQIAPNHVLCGEPDYHGGPAGEPLNAQPFPEEPYSNPVKGPPVIAVLDTGYDPAVPQLHKGLAWRIVFTAADEENAIGANGYLRAEGGHGTFVDGVIMRLAPQAIIRQVLVLNPDGVGDDASVAIGIAQAKTPVINLSLGGYTQHDAPPPATSAALAALPPDVAVIAAAGNNNSSRKFYPAAHERVIGVGAVDTSNGQLGKASFSNYGGWVKVYLPGVGVRSTYLRAIWKLPSDPQPRPIDGTARWGGTSFCAPQFAALIAAAIPQAGTARQVAQQLLDSARQVANVGAVLIPGPGVID